MANAQYTTWRRYVPVVMTLIAAVAVGALIGFEAIDEHEQLVTGSRLIVRRFSTEFAGTAEARDAPPVSYDASRRAYNFGRYTRPIKHMNVGPMSPLHRVAADKGFVWIGMNDGEWHVSMALLQFNYAAAAVVSVYCPRTNASWSLYRDLPALLALIGPKFVADGQGRIGVSAGCVKYGDLWATMSVCYNESTATVDVAADVWLKPDIAGVHTAPSLLAGSANATRLVFNYSVDIGLGTFPNMVMPLGANRAVSVSKYAARPIAQGHLSLTTESGTTVASRALGGALAATDYTRGLLRRRSVWKWLCLSTTLEGTNEPYGLHISTDTYDFGEKGASSESSVFDRTSDGPGFMFYDEPDVAFRQLNMTARKKTDSQWHITGPDLDLVFTPHGGTFHGDIHLGVIDCDLWHMWGTFSGYAPRRRRSADAAESGRVPLRRVAGVLEDHFSLW
jgi:hypothetical protein